MTVVSIYFAQDLLIFRTCMSWQMITSKVLVSCFVAVIWINNFLLVHFKIIMLELNSWYRIYFRCLELWWYQLSCIRALGFGLGGEGAYFFTLYLRVFFFDK